MNSSKLKAGVSQVTGTGLFSPILSFFKTFINAGVHPANSLARNRQVRVVNTAGICGGTVALCFCIINSLLGNFLLAGINICTAVCLFAMVYFNSRARYELGPLITMPVCSLQLTASSLLFNNNMELYLLLVICLALILLNDRKVMLTLIILDIVLFLVAYKLSPVTVQHQATETRRFINVVIWLMLLLGCLYYFRVQIMNYTKELEEKNQQLAMLNKTKEKLISVIAHDMRSPIATLHSILDLVNKQLLPEKELPEFTKDLSAQLEVLQDNMDGLVKWCYSQMKGINPQPVQLNVTGLLQEVALFLQPQMQQKNIRLSMELPAEPVVVEADMEHIRLIVRNLLSNAIKFSHPHGTVLLSLQPAANGVRIAVQDFGIGMDADTQAKIFSASNLYPARGTRNEKGVGLGLSLSQEFAQKNNGYITVESNPGKGSIFSLYLRKNG